MKAPRETTEQAVALALSGFQELMEAEGQQERYCLVYGTGGQPRKLYKQLETWDGVCVKYTGSVLPLPLAWLGFIPSRAGVVEVLDAQQLKPLFEAVSASSMAGVFWVTENVAERLIALVSARAGIEKLFAAAADDPESVAYLLDANNPSSKTGLFDWFYFGNAVQASLQSRLVSSAHSRSP